MIKTLIMIKNNTLLLLCIVFTFFFQSCGNKVVSDKCGLLCDKDFITDASLGTVTKYIEKESIDINPSLKGTGKNSPLATAVLADNIQIAHYFIDNDADLNFQSFNPKLTIAMMVVIKSFYFFYNLSEYDFISLFNFFNKKDSIDKTVTDKRGNSTELYLELGKQLVLGKTNIFRSFDKENLFVRLENYIHEEELQDVCLKFCRQDYRQSRSLEEIKEYIDFYFSNNAKEDVTKEKTKDLIGNNIFSSSEMLSSRIIIQSLYQPQLVQLLIDKNVENAFTKSRYSNVTILELAIEIYNVHTFLNIVEDLNFPEVFIENKKSKEQLEKLKQSVEILIKNFNTIASQEDEKTFASNGINQSIKIYKIVNKFK